MGEAGHTIYGFRPFWTQAAIQYHLDVYTHTNQAFAGKCFCTQVLLHSERPSHRDGLKRGIILQWDASTRRCSYAEMLSTQRCLYTRCFRTQMLLHRDNFGKKNF